MKAGVALNRIRPGWWTLILIVAIAALVFVCSALFAGTFRSFIPVTLTSDRSGLVLESGAKVKLRGVQVGRVATVTGGRHPVRLGLDIYPEQVDYIPANVEAQIRATTLFGAKYVDLVYPEHPSRKHISAGDVVRSRNVSTEVNTVFQNLVDLLQQIDPAKMNATLTAIADGVRGQGERIGQATSDANQVLQSLNPRMDTLHKDWRATTGFADAYSDAAQDLAAVLDAASTTSVTVTNHADDLDALLLNTIGLARAGTGLLGPNQGNLVQAVNGLEPTTTLLRKYDPVYACLLLGSKWFLDNGGYERIGGNGRTSILDSAILLGDDPYRYPDNLPLVAAKGGPGGKPGCGSLPDASKNFPVRQLVTNTGWGTGLDIRPNPGIGHPWWVNYLPATRAVPESPSFHGLGPPAIGPVPNPAPPPGPLGRSEP